MKRKWKYYLGISLLVFNAVSYPIIALLPFLGLSAATVASLSAGLVIADEIAFLGAVALLGKEFLEKIKTKVKGWFARPAAPPRPVGKRRHYCGVALLLISFLPYFAAEAMLLLGCTRDSSLQWVIALLLSSDLLFILSLFLLGGDFWERLKRLFEWRGEAGEKQTVS